MMLSYKTTKKEDSIPVGVWCPQMGYVKLQIMNQRSVPKEITMKLQVIPGGSDHVEHEQLSPKSNELALLFKELHSEPHKFSQADFERAIDACRANLSINDILDLTARRVRLGEYSDRLEQNALLSIIEGRYENAERLFELRDRRDKLGLKITS